MKNPLAPVPFLGFRVSKVFDKEMGRYIACLYPASRPSILRATTTSWARYVMSVSLGRRLRKDEHVDHIDENKVNDEIGNLQVLTPLQNILKSVKPRVLIHLVCAGCGRGFMRRKGRRVREKNYHSPACARQNAPSNRRRAPCGTKAAYRYCHCSMCKAAQAAYQKEWNRKRALSSTR